jgi:hypothetical protein
MASFDVKRVTPLEWTGVGGGALAFIASFFPWYSISFDGFGGFDVGGSANAWDFALSLFAVLMLVAAGVLVLLPHLGTQVPNLALIWLALAGVAALFIILRWVTFETGGEGVSAGAGFGLFIGLLAAVVSAVGAFLTYRAASRTRA